MTSLLPDTVMCLWGVCVERDPQRMRLDFSAQQPARTSRPLRTGKNFVLVVPSRRVVVRRWDKVDYQPGEECRLNVLGRGLGKRPLSITVESESEDGRTWTAVARLGAEVAADEGEAVANWRFPGHPVVPGVATVREADGSELSHARFEDHRDLEREGAVWMLARAPGFEGKAVKVVLEREGEPGEWLPVGEAVATVQSAALRTAVALNASKEFQVSAPAPRIVSQLWDRADYQPGDACRLSVLGSALGRGPLSITVEAEGANGSWTAVERLKAKVSIDENEALSSWTFPAHAVIPGAATLREADGSSMSHARFDDRRDLEEGGTVWVVARASGLDGRGVQVVLEREDASGGWVPIGQATATVRSGAVRAAVTPDKNRMIESVDGKAAGREDLPHA